MSDQPNRDQSETLIQIANEYRRLQRQLESKQQQLSSLLEANGEAGDFPTDFEGIQNRRYNIDFQFKPDELIPQEKSVMVNTGTIFRCAAMESFVRAIGTGEDAFITAPVAVQVTLSWDQRVNLFDYMFRVRDTGTDREWFNNPQPAIFGGGGYIGPLWFPRRNVLGGGTVIYAEVAPFASSSTGSAFFSDGTVESYILQLSFIGHEVPDRSQL